MISDQILRVRCHDRRQVGECGYDPKLGYWYQVAFGEEIISGGDGYTSLPALIRASKGLIDWRNEVRTVAWLREAPERADQETNPDALVRDVLTQAQGYRLKAS